MLYFGENGMRTGFGGKIFLIGTQKSLPRPFFMTQMAARRQKYLASILHIPDWRSCIFF